MTQPTFAPIPLEDEVRAAYRLGVPAAWVPARPGELLGATRRSTVGGREQLTGARLPGAGSPGPDQGYALRLAERFASRLVLEEGERSEDVLAGAVAIALRRAALFGRAPVGADLEVALGLFGFLGSAPAALVARRKAVFAGLGHDEWRRRALVHGIDEAALRLSARQAMERPLDGDQLASL